MKTREYLAWVRETSGSVSISVAGSVSSLYSMALLPAETKFWPR